MSTYIWLLFLAFIAYRAYRFYIWKNAKPTFVGKTVFITGGSSGIGEEMTKRFVDLGAKQVIIASRNIKEMERVKNLTSDPSRVQVMQLDLSKPEECMSRVQEFAGNAKYGIDIVVNNAGVTMRDEFNSFDFSQCIYMMNTNCLSHIAITKAFLPLLIKQKGGQFVNIISVAGQIGVGLRTMYSAAKFGTAGFFKSLRSEVKQYGIAISNVYPEFVRTNVSKNAILGGGKVFGKTDSNILNGIRVD